MTWRTIAGGASIGGEGSENGIILQDEEFSDRARITLEKDAKSAPFAITCGIYGWMFHTRSFSSLPEAIGEYDRMKAALSDILTLSPDRPPDAERALFVEAIGEFVSRFP